MKQHNDGDTVEVVRENGSNIVGEYKGVEVKEYGKAHVVEEFKTGRRLEFAIGSKTESVKEYSVI